MKISLSWLNDFVDLRDHSAEQVADLLSLHTAEVEGVEAVGAALAQVLVGEVLECGRHPDAEKLSVTKVGFGGDQAVQVVCGAPNVAQGQKIAFAPVGTVLPGGLKLKKAKLRGQESCGMICSERELELSEEHEGILVLDPTATVGQALIDHLNIRDAVLELDNKSLTHRPDLWGHYGFARELATILKRPLKPLEVLKEWPQVQGDVPIELHDAEGCPKYLGLPIDLGGKPGPSPAWLRNRLIAVGQRPINDVVDLTNYLLLETGQPTHAFDMQLLKGPAIRVRAAADGELFTTLDEVERKLTPNDLVIADAERSVALAGVMGGLHTEVCSETQQVLLESAVFHPVRVRRTSKRLALRTEASSRFEKSLDPALAEQALRRFAVLLERARPQAKLLAAPSGSGEASAPEYELSLNTKRTSELLSLELSADQIAEPLERLGFTVDRGDGVNFTVGVPTWRATKDVTTDIDLVEEVGRIAGYHHVDPQPLEAPVEAPPQESLLGLARKLSDRLAGVHQGFESQSYTFLDRTWAQHLGMEPDQFVRLQNPVQDGVDLVRRDPIPSLLAQIRTNLQERDQGMLFEFAKGYQPNGDDLPEEMAWMGVVAWRRGDLPQDGPDSVFGLARGLTEDLLRTCAVFHLMRPQSQALPTESALRSNWAHPAQRLSWTSKQDAVAVSAKLDPRLAGKLDLEKVEVAIVLIDMLALDTLVKGRTHKFVSPAKLPAIKVDVALALPKTVAYEKVEAGLRQAAGKLLDHIELFDRFEGESIGAGNRSLAFHVLLRAGNRTLTDKDEQKFLTRAEKLAEQLGGSLRK